MIGRKIQTLSFLQAAFSIRSLYLQKFFCLKERILSILLFFFCMPAFSPAQSGEMDSLLSLLRSAKPDTNKVQLLETITYQYYYSGDFDQAISYAEQTHVLADQLGDKKRNATALNILGNLNNIQGNITKALEFYKRSLKIREDMQDKNAISASLSNIGLAYDYIGDYPKALDHFLRSLRMSEETGDENGSASTYVSIGNVYIDLKNYPKALEYQQEALKRFLKTGKKAGISAAYGNIGNVYNVQGNYSLALEYYEKSAAIVQEAGDKLGIGRALSNVANAHHKMGNYSKAEEYYIETLRLREEIGNKNGIVNSTVGLAEIYTKTGKYDKALFYLNYGLKIAKEINAKDLIEQNYQGLAEACEKMNRHDKALEYFKMYSDMRDTLLGEENAKYISRMGAMYDSERKDNEINLLNKDKEKQEALRVSERKKQRVITIVVSIGLFFVLIFAFFIYRSYRQKQKDNVEITRQKEIIEEKNKEVHDSITYAKRIQAAILPPDKLVTTQLGNSFVLFKPKDIVSGDFYWIETAGEKTLLAAVDCTGHGVPGAMVSVVGYNALNSCVKEFGLTEPAAILDKLTSLVEETFDRSDSNVKDGMDISLICLEKKNGKKSLEFAGANNPLWLVRKGKVEEIKGDKQPIGKFDQRKPFRNHKLELEKGDNIYLFTDGFADQFGGPKGKKFKYKQLGDLLLEIRDKDMNAQKELLHSAFENWRTGLEQVDDVCIIGLKIE